MTEKEADRIAGIGIASVLIGGLAYMVLSLVTFTQQANDRADPAYTWVGNELTWTDPAHGCRYLIGDDGSRNAMVLPTGLPDCGGK